MSITQTDLRELFKYDKDTGIFTRVKAVAIRSKIGESAGYKTSSGYWSMKVKGKAYRLHRLAWLYEFGIMPDKIDHINHNVDDNRICNLRNVSQSENVKNASLYKTNNSGYFGVSWHSRDKVWQSNIRVNNVQIFLGSYIEKDDAIKARKEAEMKYGFHKNHGKREVA